MAFDAAWFEQLEEGRQLARQFVLDAMEALRKAGDSDGVNYLGTMLREDGPDIDGCVACLGRNDLVTQDWVDRLTTLHEVFGDLEDELAELTDYLKEREAASAA